MKYREDLDMMQQPASGQRSRNSRSLADGRPAYHNILTNPMPYNIQNPYILK